MWQSLLSHFKWVEKFRWSSWSDPTIVSSSCNSSCKATQRFLWKLLLHFNSKGTKSSNTTIGWNGGSIFAQYVPIRRIHASSAHETQLHFIQQGCAALRTLTFAVAAAAAATTYSASARTRESHPPLLSSSLSQHSAHQGFQSRPFDKASARSHQGCNSNVIPCHSYLCRLRVTATVALAQPINVSFQIGRAYGRSSWGSACSPSSPSAEKCVKQDRLLASKVALKLVKLPYLIAATIFWIQPVRGQDPQLRLCHLLK